jgi:uncharacterized protein YceH (UPF0502 family)
MKKYGAPFFIDEADRVVRKSLLIETFRDIADLSRVPIIMIGQENIYSTLQREGLGNVFSRITEAVEFGPLAVKDVQIIAQELCDLKCSTEAATLIRTITLGDFRLVNALLTRTEQICNLNDKTEITVHVAREAAKGLPDAEDLRDQAETEQRRKPSLMAEAA